MKIKANNLIHTGDIAAVNYVEMTVNTLNSQGDIRANEDITINASADMTTAGTIRAGNNLSLSAANDYINSGQISAGQAALFTVGKHLNNRSTGILSGDNTNINAANVDNAGIMQAINNLQISVSALMNNGVLQSSDKLDIASTGAFNTGKKSKTTADGTVVINAVSINHQGDLKAGKDAKIIADSLTISGVIASVTDVELAVNSLNSQGEIRANNDIKIYARKDITTAGTITAGNNLTLASTGGYSNSGVISAEQAAQFTVGTSLINQSTGVLSGVSTSVDAFNVENSGILQAINNLKIDVARLMNNGVMQSADHLNIISSEVFNTSKKSKTTADGVVAINAASINHQGDLNVGDTVKIKADSLTISGTLAAAKNIELAVNKLESQGDVRANNDITIDASANITTAGTIRAGNNLSLTTATNYTNNGEISAGQVAQFTVGSSLTNQSKGILSGNTTNINAVKAHNAGILQAIDNLQFDVAALMNHGVMQSSDNLNITSSTMFNTGKGSRTTADGTMVIKAVSIDHQGDLKAGKTAFINVGSLTHTGKIAAESDIELAVNTLNSQGIIRANKNVTITAGADITTTGTIRAGDDLTLTTINNYSNSGEISAGKSAQFNVSNKLINHSAGILSADNTKIYAEHIENSGILQALTNIQANVATFMNNGVLQSGDKFEITGNRTSTAAFNTAKGSKIISDGSITIDAANINHQGDLKAGQRATIKAGSLTLSGEIAAVDDIELTVKELSSQGDIRSNNNIIIQATDDIATAGTITAGNNLSLTTKQAYSNDGVISAGKSAQFRVGTSLTNQANGVLTGNSTDIKAVDIDNAGILQALTHLQVSVASLMNDGVVQSGGYLGITSKDEFITGQKSKTIAAGALEINAENINHQGELSADDVVQIKSDNLTHTGSIAAVNYVELAVNALNSQGDIRANKDITINATADVITAGAITAGNNLTLTTAKKYTNSGVISAGNSALFKVGAELVNQSTGILSGNSTDINAAHVENAGTLQAIDNLQASVRSFTNNGIVQSSGNLGITSAASFNTAEGSKTSADGTVSVNTASINHQGYLIAGKTAQLKADNLTHTGEIASKNDIKLTVNTLNSQGDIRANKDITINATADVTTTGVIRAGNNLSLTTVDSYTNRGAISAGKVAQFTIGTNLNNQSTGVLSANSNNINAVKVENTGILQAMTNLQVSVATLMNNGVVQSSENLGITSTAAFNTGKASKTAADGTMVISALSINHQGVLKAGKTAHITADNLTHTGGIASENDIELTVDTLTSQGSIRANKDITIDASADIITAGTIRAGNDLTLTTADNYTNSGEVSAGQVAQFRVGVSLINESTGVLSGNNTDINAVKVENTGTLQAIDNLQVSVNTFNNNAVVQSGDNLVIASTEAFNTSKESKTTADGALVINAKIINHQGELKSGKTAQIKADNLTHTGEIAAENNIELAVNTLSSQGDIRANNNITIDANADIASTGSVRAGNDLTLTTAASYTNRGAISAGQTAKFIVGTELINQSSGLLSGNATDIHAVHVENRGILQSIDNLRANVATLMNHGTVQSGNNLAITSTVALNTAAGSKVTAESALTINAASINHQGDLSAGEIAKIETNSLTQSGEITSLKDVELTVNTLNSQGNVHANNNLMIIADADIATTGTISAGNNLSITTLENYSNSGTISAGQTAKFTVGADLNNQLSGILSGNNTEINADHVENVGILQAITHLQANVATLMNHGVMQSSENLEITSTAAFNTGKKSKTTADGVVTINAASINHQGKLKAGKTAQIKAGNLTHTGSIAAEIDVELTVNTLNSQAGVRANNDITINATADIITTGVIRAGNNLSLTTAESYSNSGAISAGKVAQFKVGKELANQSSGVLSGNRTEIVAEDIENTGTLQAVTKLQANVATLTNNGVLQSSDNLSVTSTDAFNTSEGSKTTAEGTLEINAASMDHQGNLRAGDVAKINASSLTHTGEIASVNYVELAVHQLNSQGNILANKDITIDATADVITTGTIKAGNNLRLISKASYSNSGVISAGQLAQLTIGTQLTNKSTGILSGNSTEINAKNVENVGILQAIDNLQVSVATLINNGIVQSGDKLSITSTAAFNTAKESKTTADGVIAINAASINHQGELKTGTTAQIKAGNLTHSGDIAAAKDIELAVNTLTSLGEIRANNNITIHASSDIMTAGTVTAGNNLSLTSTENYTNSGIISAGKAALFTTGTTLTNQASGILSGKTTGINAATAKNQGILQAISKLQVSVATLMNNGVVQSGDNLGITSTDKLITEQESKIIADGDMVINAASIDHRGYLSAGKTANIKADSLTHTGNIVSMNYVELAVNQLNSQGDILANKDITIDATADIVTAGTIKAGNNLSLTTAQSYSNSGVISAEQAAQFNIGTQLTNQSAGIVSGASTDINAGIVENAGILQAVNQLQVSVATLMNHGIVQSSGDLAITSTTAFNTTEASKTTADGVLAINAVSMKHQGDLSAKQTLNIKADHLTHSGDIVVKQDIKLTVNTLNSQGDIRANKDITIDAAADIITAGTIRAGNNLTLTSAESYTNLGEVSAGQAAQFTVGTSLSNQSTGVLSGDRTVINAANLENTGILQAIRKLQANVSTLTNNGIAQSGDSLSITSTTALNTGEASKTTADGVITINAANINHQGILGAKQSVQIKADHLTHSGDIVAEHDIALAVKTLTSQGGIRANNDITIDATADIITAGTIRAGNNLTLTSADSYNNSGVISAGQTARFIIGTQLTNQSTGVLSGDRTDINVAKVENKGILQAITNLQASVNTFINKGTTQSAGNLGITSTTEFVSELGSKITADGDVVLNAASINHQGDLSAKQAVQIKADSLTHTGGIAAVKNIALAVNTLNSQGDIRANRDITINAAADMTTAGTIRAGNNLSLTANKRYSNSGKISAGQTAKVSVGTLLSNQSTGILSGYKTNIDAVDVENAGILQAVNNLQANIATFMNNGVMQSGDTLGISGNSTSAATFNTGKASRTTAEGELAITATSMHHQGYLKAGKNATIKADVLMLTGEIASVNNIELSVNTLNSRGNVRANNDISIDATADINTAGTIRAGNDLRLVTTKGYSNSGKISAGQAAQFTIGTKLNNQSTGVLSGTSTGIHAADVENTGILQAIDNLQFEVAALMNNGVLQSGNKLEITANSAANDIGNSTATLAFNTGKGSQTTADGMLEINAASINHQGYLRAGETVNIKADNLANTGEIASVNDIELAVNELDSQGDVRANNDITIDATAGITTAGVIRAGNDLSLTTAGNYSNSGKVSAGQAAQFTVASILTNQSSGILSGTNTDINAVQVANAGILQAVNDLQFDVAKLMNNGVVQSGRNLAITSISSSRSTNPTIFVTSKGSKTTAEGVLTLDMANVNHQGYLRAGEAAEIKASSLTNTGEIAALKDIELAVTTLNSQGAIGANNDITINASADVITAGAITAGNNLTLTTADSYSNNGKVSAGNAARFIVGSALTNQASGILSGNSTDINAAQVTNTGILQAVTNLQANVATLMNNGVVQSGENLNITSTSAFNTGLKSSTIANGAMTINAASINHQGDLSAEQNVIIKSDSLTLSGEIAAVNDIELTVNTLTSQGDIRANHDVTIAATADITTAGSIRAGNNLSLTTKQSYSNSGAISAGKSAQFTISKSLNNQTTGILSGDATAISAANIENQGILQAVTELKANVTRLMNNGVVQSGGSLTITGSNSNSNTSTAVLNTAKLSKITADGTLDINARNINHQGYLRAGDTAKINADNLMHLGTIASVKDVELAVNTLNSQGDIRANNDITIKAAADITTAGTIRAGNNLVLSTTDNYSNSGAISAGQAAQFTVGKSLTNQSSGVLSGNRNGINATKVENAGILQAIDNLQISVATLMNNAVIQSGDSLAVTSKAAFNTGKESKITADGTIVIKAGSMDYQGDMSAKQSVQITADSLLQKGDVAAVKDVALAVTSLNSQGDIRANHDITIAATADITTVGTIRAGNNLSLTTANNYSNSGVVSAGKIAKFTVGANLTNQSSGLLSGSTTNINATKVENTGILQALNNLQANVATLMNNGVLQSGGNLTVTGKSGDHSASIAVFNTGKASKTTADGTLNINAVNINHQGYLKAGETANIKADSLIQSGDITAVKNIELNVNALNSQGNILANNDITINATAGVTTTGTVTAGNNLTLSTTESYSNSGAISAGKVAQFTVGKNLTNQSSGLLSGNNTSIKAANVENSGILQAINDLQASVAKLMNHGLLQTGNNLALTSTTAFNTAKDSKTTADGAMTINADSIDHKGLLRSGKTAKITTGDMTQSGDLAAVEDVVLTVHSLDSLGDIRANNNITIDSTAAVTTAGTIRAGNNLSLTTADSYNNSGVISAGQAQFTVGKNLTNQSTGLLSGNSNTISAVHVENNGILQAVNNLQATVASLMNNGVMQSADNLAVTSKAAFNTGKTSKTTADGTLVINAGVVNHQGYLRGGDTAKIQTGTLTQTGDIDAFRDVELAVTTLDSQGNIRANNNISINATADITTAGTLIAGNDLSLTTKASYSNSGSISAGNNAQFTINKKLTNQATGLLSANANNIQADDVANSGTLQAVSNLQFNVATLMNNGVMQSGDDLAVTSTATFNTSKASKTTADGALTINAVSIDHQGYLKGGETATIKADSVTQGGDIVSVKDIELTVNSLNSQANILANNDITINAANALTTTGAIKAGNKLSLTTSGDYINPLTGVLSGKHTSINAARFENIGMLQAFNNLEATVSSFINNGTVQSGDKFTVTSAAVFNTAKDSKTLAEGVMAINAVNIDLQGNLSSGETAQFKADSLTHTGNIAAVNNVELTVNTLNSQGDISANQNITINATGDVVTTSAIRAGNNLTLTTAKNFTNSSEVSAGKVAQFNVGTVLTNQVGGTLSGNDTAIHANTLANAGALQGMNNVQLWLTTFNNTGATVAMNDLIVNTTGNLANTGLVYAGNDGYLYVQGEVSNTEADILTGGNLVIQADADGVRSKKLLNSSGTIEAGSDLTVKADLIHNKVKEINYSERTENVNGLLSYDGTVMAHALYFDTGQNYWKYSAKIETKLVTKLHRILETTGSIARMLSGQNMVLEAEKVTNEISQITANKDMFISSASLGNTAYQSEIISNYRQYRIPAGSYATLRDPGAPRDIPVPVKFTFTGKSSQTVTKSKSTTSSITAGGKVVLNVTDQVNNSVVKGNAEHYTSNSQNNDAKQVGTAAVTAPTLSGVDNTDVDSKGTDINGVATTGINNKAINITAVDNSDVDSQGAEINSVASAGVDGKGADITTVDSNAVTGQGAKIAGVDNKGAVNKGVDISNVDSTDIDRNTVDITGVDSKNVDSESIKISSIDNTNVDSKGAAITGIDSSTVASKGVNVTGVSSSGVDNTGAAITGVDGSTVDSKGAAIAGVDSSTVDSKGADITGVDNVNIDSKGAEITGVDSHGVNSAGAEITAVDSTNVDSKGAEITGIDKTSVNGTGINMTTVEGSDVDSHGVAITGVDGSGVSSTDVNMTTIDSSGVTGASADITDIDNSAVDSTGVRITNVDSTNVDSKGAVITGVDSSGVARKNADITNVDSTAVDSSGTAITNIDSTGVGSTGIDIAAVNSKGVDAKGADITGVDSSDVDSTGANMTTVDSSNVASTNVAINEVDNAVINSAGVDITAVNADGVAKAKIANAEIDSNGVAVTDATITDVSNIKNDIPFPEFRLPTNPNGLFVYTDGPDSHYLIETNPTLTNMDKFLGSDYLFKSIDFNPEKDIKVLGDAFYDTRIISQEIFEKTGQRYLTDNVGTDLEQMKQLLDSAASEADSLGLQAGVTLTQEQVAGLTKNVVWWEPTDVNGKTVLAPKLYLSSATQDNVSKGALIAGNDVVISAGNISNSGSIDAKGNLTLVSRDTIINNGGQLVAQGNTTLQAVNDIANIGGTISGDNVQIVSEKGSVINKTLVTLQHLQANGTLTDQANASNIVFTDTKVGTTGSIVAKNRLVIQAGNNIEISAANLSSGGDTSLVAANDVIIKAEEERYFEAISVGRDSSTSLVTTQNSSVLSAGGDLRIKAGNSITAVASTFNAADALVLSANLDISIKAAVEEVFSTNKQHRQTQKDRSIRNKSSELAGNYVLLASGNDVTLEGSQISAIHDAAITAKNSVSILAVNDSDYHFFETTKKKSFGRKKTRIEESMQERVVGSDINAGGNLTIQAQKFDGALLAGGDSNITVIGSRLNAGGLVNLAADGDVVIAAQKYTEFTRNQTIKKGVGGFSSKESVNAHSANKLGSSDLISGGHVSIQSGNDVAVLASNLTAEGNVNITAVDEVLVAAGEVLTTSEQWSKKGGLFSGGALYSQQFKLNGNKSSTAQSSVIKSGNFVEISAGNVKLVGSDINATDSVKLIADVGDIEIFAAKEYNNSYSEEENLSVSITGLGDTIFNPQDSVSVKDGRLTVKLAEANYDKVDSKTDITTHRSSNIGADNNLSLNAAANVMVEGSSLVADADNDQQGNVNLIAGDSVVIKEATNTTTSTTKEIHGKAEVSVMVQHQAVEVAKALVAVKDAKDKLKDSRKEYSQYKKKLASLEDTLATLEQEFADNKPGINADDIDEIKDLVSDVKSDEAWYVTGIALATEDVASKGFAVAQQLEAAANSEGTYGFNAGLQLDIEASKTKSEQQSTSSLASNVAGNNIHIQAGSEEINQVLIQGSHLQATDSLAVTANEVNIVASKDTATSSSETKSGTISASMTVYGVASGINLNASLNRSQNKSSQTTHTNSTLNADNISITSGGDTNIKGANVEADKQLLVNVGGALNVESVQDRIKSSNKGMGISAGMSLTGGKVPGTGGFINNFDGNAGDLTGGNGGINFSNGRSYSKQTVLTSLTSGNNAVITVGGNTDVKGALIATVDEDGNDLGNLDLSTETFSYTDLNNTNYSKDQSMNLSGGMSYGEVALKKDEKPPVLAPGDDGKKWNIGESPSLQYKNESQYDKGKTLATVGQGNFTVGNQADSVDTTALNRDTDNVKKDLFSVERTQGNFDVTFDTRLLNEEGQEQIEEQVEKMGENIQKTAQNVPGEEGGNVVENTIGKTLNYLGDKTFGITPSDKNSGGLIAEIPIIFGTADNKAGAFLVTQEGSDYAKKFADTLMPAEELPYYKDLPEKSQKLLTGLLVSIDPHKMTDGNKTEQMAGNGINNILEEAIVNGLRQTGAKQFTQNYNPSHGGLPDGVEYLFDAVFADVDFIATGMAKQTAETVVDAAKVQKNLNYVAHSQNNALLKAGLGKLGTENVATALEGAKAKMTVVSNGSPVNNKSMKDILEASHIDYSASHSNSGDMVSEFLGGNFGDYVKEENKQSEHKPFYTWGRISSVSGGLTMENHSNYDYKTKVRDELK